MMRDVPHSSGPPPSGEPKAPARRPNSRLRMLVVTALVAAFALVAIFAVVHFYLAGRWCWACG